MRNSFALEADEAVTGMTGITWQSTGTKPQNRYALECLAMVLGVLWSPVGQPYI